MLWRSSRVTPAAGFIEPCIPTQVKVPPLGPKWVYEVKHDGFRLMVRKAGDRVRIYTRRGADWTDRYPAIVAAARRVAAESFLIDGEGVICGPDGLADFDRLQSRTVDNQAILQAFDLLELDGAADIRRQPLIERKGELERLLGGARTGIVYNEHIAEDGAVVFRAACRLGLEGIVAKRIDLPYRSGKSRCWLKIKNPTSPAVLRFTTGDE